VVLTDCKKHTSGCGKLSKFFGSSLAQAAPGLALVETVSSTMGHRVWQSSNAQVSATTAECGQRLAQQGLHHPPSSCIHSPEQMTQVYQEHGMTAFISCQLSTPDTGHGVEHPHMMPATLQVSHAESIYDCPHDTFMTSPAYQQQQQQSSGFMMASARSTHNHSEMHQMHAPSSNNCDCRAIAVTPHSQQAYPYSSDPFVTHSDFCHSKPLAQMHHHHHLPNHPPSFTFHSVGCGNNVYTDEEYGSQSVVGQPGMPEPAAKPKGPKVKFSPGEDALLVELKETKNLTWKQIADFFPGRNSGTLQVRYCTKLKATAMVWTEDKVGRCWTKD
jgi:hypothetical protein